MRLAVLTFHEVVSKSKKCYESLEVLSVLFGFTNGIWVRTSCSLRIQTEIRFRSQAKRHWGRMVKSLKSLPRSLRSQKCLRPAKGKGKRHACFLSVKSRIYNSSPLTINAAYWTDLRLKKSSEESLFQQGEILENSRNTNLLIPLEGSIVQQGTSRGQRAES